MPTFRHVVAVLAGILLLGGVLWYGSRSRSSLVSTHHPTTKLWLHGYGVVTGWRRPWLVHSSPLVESPSPPSPPPPPLSVTTTTIIQVVPGDALVSTAPAWVQAAFACIRHRESNTTPTIVNTTSGDNGLYQFATTTWLANGGGQFASGARYASRAEQDTVAYWTWKHDGFSPWTGDTACFS